MTQLPLVSIRGGLEGAQVGVPYEFSDKPIDQAYATDRLMLESVKFLQGQGMNPAMPAFRNMLSQEWQWIGTGDVSMPEERSRDVAVGTFRAMQQMGDLPLKMHQEDLAEEEAIGFRVMLDYKRAYMTIPEMVNWVDEMGAQRAEQVTADMLAPVNVSIQTIPDWTGLDVDRVQAIAQFMGQVTDPEMRALLAPAAGFPPEVVQKMRAQASQAGPSAPPDKLMQGLAALAKSGAPIAPEHLYAVLKQAGLMPNEAAQPENPGPPSGAP